LWAVWVMRGHGYLFFFYLPPSITSWPIVELAQKRDCAAVSWNACSVFTALGQNMCAAAMVDYWCKASRSRFRSWQTALQPPFLRSSLKMYVAKSKVTHDAMQIFRARVVGEHVDSQRIDMFKGNSENICNTQSSPSQPCLPFRS
jgi:hypothetical protein